MTIPKVSQSQSLSIGGSSQQSGNVQLGAAQAGRDSVQTQTQQNDQSQAPALTPDDVVALIGQIEALFRQSALPEAQKNKAIQHLDTAKEEVQAEEPDKDFAAKNLQRATKILKEAGEAAEAGRGLLQTVSPLVAKLGPWLGVAASFLL